MEETGEIDTLHEDTIPNTEESSETAEAEKNANLPQGADSQAEQSEVQTEDNTDAVPNKADQNFLPVKFLHEERTLNREEAVKYAQMGMNYERFEPMISKLDYLAAVQGVSRENYIDRQVRAHEENILQELIERYGDDEKMVSEMFEYTKQKHQKSYEDMVARQQEEEQKAKESTETRLAGEYTQLVKEFPELVGKTFKDLPAEVKKAGFGGEKLLSAYLYYKHSEDKKIKEATAAQESAARKSTGPMRGTDTDSKTEAERQYLNGLWSK